MIDSSIACVAGVFIGVWWPAAEPLEDENFVVFAADQFTPIEAASYSG